MSARTLHVDSPNVVPMVRWEDIEDGDVLAFHGRGFWSSLIKLRTWSRITHCGFAHWHRGMLCVFEAREMRGVRLYPLHRYLGSSTARVDLYKLRERDVEGRRLTFDRNRLISFALAHWGARYAHPLQFLRSFGIITRWVCDRLGIPIDTDVTRFFCSEFVVSGLSYALGRAISETMPPAAPPAIVTELKELSWMGRLRNEHAPPSHHMTPPYDSLSYGGVLPRGG